MGLISVQAANPTVATTAAAAFTALAHFINVPFGLLIREVLITDATAVSKLPPSNRWPATESNLTRECNSRHATCLLFATVWSARRCQLACVFATSRSGCRRSVATALWAVGAARLGRSATASCCTAAPGARAERDREFQSRGVQLRARPARSCTLRA